MQREPLGLRRLRVLPYLCLSVQAAVQMHLLQVTSALGGGAAVQAGFVDASSTSVLLLTEGSQEVRLKRWPAWLSATLGELRLAGWVSWGCMPVTQGWAWVLFPATGLPVSCRASL